MNWVEASPDPAQMAELERVFRETPRAIPRVLSRALNRGGSKMNTELKRAAAGQMHIPQFQAKRRIWLNKSTLSALEVRAKAGQVGLPLIDFHPRKTATGVRALVDRRHVVRGAFIATMPSGHQLVAKRKGERPLPIFEQRTRPVSEAALPDAPRVLAAGQTIFEQRVSVEMDLILSGKRGG